MGIMPTIGELKNKFENRIQENLNEDIPAEIHVKHLQGVETYDLMTPEGELDYESIEIIINQIRNPVDPNHQWAVLISTAYMTEVEEEEMNEYIDNLQEQIGSQEFHMMQIYTSDNMTLFMYDKVTGHLQKSIKGENMSDESLLT